MHARLLGKDPGSQEGQSLALFATDRTNCVTYVVQGCRVSDPPVLADVGSVPDHEALVEVPEDVLMMYARKRSTARGEL